ncbi:MAG: TonB-dependent receptor, partial [Solimonas sp.]
MKRTAVALLALLLVTGTAPVAAQQAPAEEAATPLPLAPPADAAAGEPAEAPVSERATEAAAEPVDALASIAVAAPEASPAVAEEAGPAALAEVVVVAQKKIQRLQDVPMSISVVDEKTIAQWAVTDVGQAVKFTPNVTIQDAGYYVFPRVRGFGFNLNNRAFEPPAGFALDGIPYSRVEYFTAALFDVSRVEVLRGPQGTLFGKNTTAGLIHIISNVPTPDYRGFVDVQYGDYDRRRVEGAVGGPLIDGVVDFRIAGFVDDRDGFVDNTTAAVSPTAQPEMRGQDRNGLRAKLRFPDLFGSQLMLGYERSRLDAIGTGTEMYTDSPLLQSILRRYDRNADFQRGNDIASLNDPDDRKVAIDTYTVDWNAALGDWSVIALGGYSRLNTVGHLDTDGTPSPAIFAYADDRSPTTTAELRTESPTFDGLLGLGELFGLELGQSNVQAGAFFQRRGIGGDGIGFRIGGLPYLEILVASQQNDPNSALSQLLNLLYQILPPTNLLTESVMQEFDQTSDTYAVFGQLEWDFLPEWTLQLGLRLSREEKEASWNQHYTSAPPHIVLPLLGIDEFTAQQRISEDQVQPKVSLKYSPLADVNLFLHWARGFRGGGFNAFSYSGAPDELVFGPETANEWGFDIKTTLLDGRARFNVSLFRLDIDDFQVLTQIPDANGIGIGVSKVQNAAKARAQGVEADFAWQATAWLTLLGSAGYNDTEYLDFKINGCPADSPNSDGDDDPRCDASGKSFNGTPKFNYNVNSMVTLPVLDWGLLFTIGLGVEYESKKYLNDTLDENAMQGEFYRLRASLGVGDPRRGWSFQLHGDNLTDVRPSISRTYETNGLGLD